MKTATISLALALAACASQTPQNASGSAELPFSETVKEQPNAQSAANFHAIAAATSEQQVKIYLIGFDLTDEKAIVGGACDAMRYGPQCYVAAKLTVANGQISADYGVGEEYLAKVRAGKAPTFGLHVSPVSLDQQPAVLPLDTLGVRKFEITGSPQLGLTVTLRIFNRFEGIQKHATARAVEVGD
jgi:hypothetical protein